MSQLLVMKKPEDRPVPLNDDNKLSARTAPELKEAVEKIVLRLKNDVKWLKGKLNIEAVVGCAMLEFAEKSVTEQDEVIRRRKPQLEDMIWNGKLTGGTKVFVITPGPPAGAEKQEGPRPPLRMHAQDSKSKPKRKQGGQSGGSDS